MLSLCFHVCYLLSIKLEEVNSLVRFSLPAVPSTQRTGNFPREQVVGCQVMVKKKEKEYIGFLFLLFFKNIVYDHCKKLKAQKSTKKGTPPNVTSGIIYYTLFYICFYHQMYYHLLFLYKNICLLQLQLNPPKSTYREMIYRYQYRSINNIEMQHRCEK